MPMLISLANYPLNGPGVMTTHHLNTQVWQELKWMLLTLPSREVSVFHLGDHGAAYTRPSSFILHPCQCAFLLEVTLLSWQPCSRPELAQGSSQAVSRRSQPLLIISHFSTALMRGVTGRLRCFYKVVGWRALRTAVQRNASDALLLASGLLIWSGISSWWKDCTEFPFLTVAEKQKLHYFTKSRSFHSGKECWS